MKKFCAKPIYAAVLLSIPSSSFAANVLEEIVVTVQKRQETLQDVPISITAISGENLEAIGITDIKSLESTVAGLHIGSDGAYTNPTIRGVGSKLAGTGLSSNVATYVDGFYRTSSLTSNLDFLDVDAVRVLKGPQGTLFGRNATGGAILVTTKDPVVGSDLEGVLSVSYGNYNELAVKGFASTGLTDTLAASVSISSQTGDGYVEDAISGDDKIGEYDNTAVRLKIVAEPTDSSHYVFAAEYTDKDDPNAFLYSIKDNFATAGALLGAPLTNEPHETTVNGPSAAIFDMWGVSLKATFDISDEVSFTSLTQYRDEDTELLLDLDGTGVNGFSASWNQQQEYFSQEFNLTGITENTDWVLGVFYLNDDGETPYFSVPVPSLFFNSLAAPGFPGFTDPVEEWVAFENAVEIESYAIFADATWNFAENWFLTGGIRYSEDSSEASFESGPFTNAGAIGIPDFQVVPPTTVDDTWDSTTGRIVLRYEFSYNASAYASISQGFKSGLHNANGLQAQPVDPEEITSYEIGLKWQEDTWRGSMAAFYYDYTDLHVSEWVGAASIVKNAAEAEIFGVELDATVSVSDHLTVTAALAYIDSEYTDYELAAAYGDPLGNAAGGFLVRYPGNVDASGNQIIRTPEISGNLFIEYRAPIEQGEIVTTVNYSYQDEIFLEETNSISQDAYSLINARVAWNSPAQNWTLAVYGRNLTDEEYVDQLLLQDFYAGQTWGAPLTYGVEATYRF